MIDPAIVAIAEAHCAPLQLKVWKLKHLDGKTYREISYHLDLAKTTVTDAYDGANRRLRKHGVRFTPDGRPYLEETTNA